MKIHNPSPSDIPELRSLWKEAFSDTDEFLDMFFSNAFDTNRSMCITIDDKVVSALYWFECFINDKKTAYIYAVATSKSYRLQGLCSKLMKATHDSLKAKGYSSAMLVPGSKQLFTFYEKIGYKVCCNIHESEIPANKHTVILTKLSKNDFAKYRREYLPCFGVVQENENLDFLSAYADFYKGEDFIFASYINSDTLVITEFLGNTSKAPAVINTMGFKKGFIRTQGNSKPFAMYFPFDRSTPPSYFGLAFD